MENFVTYVLVLVYIWYVIIFVTYVKRTALWSSMLFVFSSSHLTSSPPRQDNAFGKSSIDVHQEISNFHFSKLQWDSDDYSLPLLSDPVHMTATHIKYSIVYRGII